VYDARDGFVLIVSATVSNGSTVGFGTFSYRSHHYTVLHPALSPQMPGLLGYDGADGYPIFLSSAQSPTTTWKFENGTWSFIATTNSPDPQTVKRGGMTYDAADQWLVLFYSTQTCNGCGVDQSFWRYRSGNWTNITTTATPPTVNPSTGSAGTEVMVYDAADGYLMLFGGPAWGDGNGSTWKFAAGAWSRICANCSIWGGSTSTQSTAYDARDSEVVTFGSVDYRSGRDRGQNATWTYAAGVWTELTLARNPPEGYFPQLTYDAADGYVLLLTDGQTWQFGGPPIAEYPVRLSFQPAGPEAILLDGIGYGNGSNLMVTNGTYAISTRATNYYNSPPVYLLFSHWAVNGGLVVFGTNLIVNGSGGNVTAYFVPYPRVTFFQDGCGPVTFNGTAYPGDYFGGSTDNFLPYQGPFPLVASTCTAFAFQEWAQNGGVRIANLTSPSTTASLTGNASVTAVYGVSGVGPAITDFYVRPSPVAPGTSITVGLVGSGGAAPYNYTYAGLPPGCTSQNQSMFSCIPTVEGTYSIRGTIRDPAGATAQATDTLIVGAASSGPSIVSFVASPPAPSVGSLLTLSVTVGGGVAPLSYLYTGLPPNCVTVSEPTLTCTPGGPGAFEVRVQVLDAQNKGSEAELNLTVAPAGGTTSNPGGLLAIEWLSIGAAVVVIVGVAVWASRRRPPAPPTGP
jgi:hypothetical protein